MTVVFADLAGFTALAETLDPEAVKDLLDRCFAVLAPVVDAHGGRIDKIVGDELMAVFGAPVAHEDDPERAVRCALGLHEALDSVGRGLLLRVGVNTGEVLAGAVGPGGSYTVTGDPVNTAHRLVSAARPGEVLVGERTHAATRDTVAYEARAAFRARGKTDEVSAWAAVGVRERDEERPWSTRSAVLVGRDDERASLLDAAARAFDPDDPRVTLVAVTGEAGVGKTRLALELQAELWERLPTGLFLRGRCRPYGAPPLWPLAEAISEAFGIEPDDEPASAAEKVAAGVEEAMPDAAHGDREVVAGRLRQLLGLEGGDDGRSAGSDPSGRRRSEDLLAAVALVVEGLAAGEPTFLLLEDLHWADEILLDGLDRAATRAAPAPVLLLATGRTELVEARPSFGTTWPGPGRVELAPLDADEAARLLALLLGGPRHPSAPTAEVDADVDADATARILEAAGGNPYFLEELTSYLVDTGGLARAADGAWRLTSRAAGALPDSVRSVIGARVDSLPADERRFLRDAAVVGRVLHADAVAALADDEPAPERVDDLVARLVDRGILEHRTADDRGDLEFRHAFTRDVVYAAVPLADRAARHAAVAAWLERRHGMALDGDAVAAVAHHYDQALELGRALGDDDPILAERARIAVLRAARQATQQDALLEAHRLFRRARDIGGAEAVDAGAVAVEHGSVLLGLRRLDDAAQAFGEATATGDPPTAAAATARLSVVHRVLGQEEHAARLAAEAIDRWRAVGDRLGEAEAVRLAAWGDLLAGLARRALPRLLHAADLEAAAGGGDGTTDQLLGWCSFLTGDTDAARHHLWTAADRMMRRGDVNGVAWCFGILGFVLLIEGRVEQARDIASNLGGLAARRGDPHGGTLCEVLLALCANEAGDLEEADRAVAAARSGLAELDDRWTEAMVALARARLATDRGDLAGARAALDEGLLAARSVRDVGNEARLTAERAVTESVLGRPAEAVAHARQALNLVRGGVGDRETELRALLVLAGAEDDDGARVLLEEAATLAAGVPTSTARATAAELSMLLARAGDLDEARRLATVAADGAEESLRAWVPARRAEATVLACGGDDAGARSVLATARAALPDGSRWAAELAIAPGSRPAGSGPPPADQ